MIKFSLFIIFILICLSQLNLIFSLKNFDSKRNLFDDSELPRVADTDILEIFHLRSFPSLSVNSQVGTFSIQSAGIALRSTQTNEVIVLQYLPNNFSKSFLPYITGMGSITGDNFSDNNEEINDEYIRKNSTLEWEKRGEILYYKEINKLYWQQSTFLGRINGIVYKKYVEWIENFERKKNLLVPQSICLSEVELASSCFLYSRTWDTFLSDSIKFFAQQSVKINAIIPPRALELKILTSSDPDLVIMISDKKYNEKMKLSEKEIEKELERIIEYDEKLLKSIQISPSSFIFSSSNKSNTSIPSSSFSFLSSSSNNINNNDNNNNNNNLNNDFSIKISYIDTTTIIDFYIELFSCLQNFQLINFFTAYKSCLSDSVAYIHIEDNYYYRVKPRYPFVYINEYLEELPNPEYNYNYFLDIIDYVVIFFFVFILFYGFILILYKMKIINFCRKKYIVKKEFNKINRVSTSSSASPPSSPSSSASSSSTSNVVKSPLMKLLNKNKNKNYLPLQIHDDIDSENHLLENSDNNQQDNNENQVEII